MSNSSFFTKVIDEVVMPFSHFLEESDVGKRDLNSEEKRDKHRLDVAKLAISLLINPNYAKEKLANAAKAHNELDIGYETMRYFLNIFFAKMVTFVEDNKLKFELKSSIDMYEEFFMQAYKPKSDEFDEFNDDFFDFDSEEVDEAINSMHYEEHKKISANEFMQEGTLDDYMIVDLNDILDKYYVQTSLSETLDHEYILAFESAIDSFSTIFNLSYEFKDMAYALENLRSLIMNLDFKSFDSDKLMLLRVLFESIINDLNTWKKEVIEEQSAIDIHYLDASLLANVSQIEIILKG